MVQLVTLRTGIRVNSNFVECLLEAFKEFQIVDPPHSRDPGHREIWIEFQGEAIPLGPSRENALLRKMEILNDTARSLQAHIPAVSLNPDLDKTYEKHAEYLKAVFPCRVNRLKGSCEIMKWSRENHNFVTGQCSIAVVSSYPVMTDFSLAVMARVLQERLQPWPGLTRAINAPIAA